MNHLLNIYHIHEGSRSLGPGLRYIIWVQGCIQNCKGCVSPDSRPTTLNHIIHIETLAKSIIQKRDIDGITISGGEPFLQASNLTRLLQIIKEKRPELNVMVFTGYTIDQLHSEKAKEFMKYIDLLIDGPYVEELNDGVGIRGSKNQHLNFLTDKLLPYKEELEKGGRNNEIIANSNGTYIIGIPRTDIKSKI